MGKVTGAERALRQGVFATDWGLPADQPVMIGMAWQWQGEAVRLDGRGDVLWLGRPLARNDTRHRARSRAARMAPPAAPQSACPPAGGEAGQPDAEPPPGGLVLTDGFRLYPARLVDTRRGRLIVFEPWLPPPACELWVQTLSESMSEPPPESRPALPLPAARGRIGGVGSGAVVETPDGPRPVEALGPGDLVLTRDQGPQPVLWRGETRLSGAELALHPALRPFRLRLAAQDGPSEMLLAPGHRLVVPALPGLDGGGDALACVADLEDGRAIRRDLGLQSVVYHHLLLARHAILTIGGLACESFHPALADPTALRWHARDLERAAPGATTVQGLFGDPALRCLSRGEAAMAMHLAA